MLLRHGEEAAAAGEINVGENGARDDDSLSVIGWQRAGALAAVLAGARFGRPERLFATAASAEHPSRRSIDTLKPLSRRLGLQVQTAFGVQQEVPLAERLEALAGVTVIAWQHEGLVRLARALMGDRWHGPERWPEGRFDLFWVLEHEAPGEPWRFAQQAQQLLAGDRPPSPRA